MFGRQLLSRQVRKVYPKGIGDKTPPQIIDPLRTFCGFKLSELIDIVAPVFLSQVQGFSGGFNCLEVHSIDKVAFGEGIPDMRKIGEPDSQRSHGQCPLGISIGFIFTGGVMPGQVVEDLGIIGFQRQ